MSEGGNAARARTDSLPGCATRADPPLEKGCLALAVLVLVIGAAMIAIGLSSGFEMLGDASLQ